MNKTDHFPNFITVWYFVRVFLSRGTQIAEVRSKFGVAAKQIWSSSLLHHSLSSSPKIGDEVPKSQLFLALNGEVGEW
jgi:hypothetical protein